MSQGHIFQINVSDGGVPKLAIPAGEVTVDGLRGDRQRDRQHHGGPRRALCLFALEQILALQAEGHPIYPGAIGENVTVAGLNWNRVVPGARLQLGSDVELAITSYAAPCRNIVAAFADANINLVSQRKFPGRARVYARVLRPGSIRVGDVVRLLAADEADDTNPVGDGGIAAMGRSRGKEKDPRP